jgi:guanylate kinase
MHMNLTSGKQIICVTGSVWTGDHRAPRKKLVKAGYVRPTWFTTTRGITDSDYRSVSMGSFHLANSRDEIFAHIEYGGGRLGILNEDLSEALSRSDRGVLIVAPPEMAVQVANKVPGAVIFTLKCASMELSRHLSSASDSRQIHRINVESEQIGAWDKAYSEIEEILGL